VNRGDREWAMAADVRRNRKRAKDLAKEMEVLVAASAMEVDGQK